LTDELKARFTASAGEGFITMQEATRALGVTRQTVLQRVKRGEIQAAHVTKGGKVGLRLKLPDRQPTSLNPPEGATIFPNLSELENVVRHEDLDATDLLHDVSGMRFSPNRTPSSSYSL